MKKIILVSILMAIIMPVFAVANWHKLENNGKNFYIDTSSILEKGYSSYLFWIKQDKNETTYFQYLAEVNCSNNTGAIQKVMTYTNENIVNTSNVQQSLDYIVPDSDFSVAYNYICALYTAKLDQQNKTKIKQQRGQAAGNILNTLLNAGLWLL